MTWGLAAGFLGGAVGTWLVRWLARRLGLVAKPNPIVPQHRTATAYLGGVGIGVGLGASVVATQRAGSWPSFLWLAAGFLALGLYDDLRPLRPLQKLAGQLVLAAIAAILNAGRVAITGRPVVDAVLLVFWIVLMVNAVNVTDVCDGLVAGISVIACGFLGFWSPGLRPLAWGLAAANIGFLVFNRPPASIFMGDAGSHLLGFALATLSFPLLGRWPDALMAGAAVGPFLFEVGFLVAVRTSRNLPWWRGSPDHFSLRMQAAGYSRWRTVLSTWVVALLACALATRLPSGSLAVHAGFVLVMAASAWVFAAWLLRHEVRPAARGVHEPGGTRG